MKEQYDGREGSYDYMKVWEVRMWPTHIQIMIVLYDRLISFLKHKK